MANSDVNNTAEVCRTCMSTDNLKSLYEDCDGDLCLIEMLMSCTLVQFSKNDGLPTRICNDCIREINRSYEFALRCEASDKQLRIQLENNIVYMKSTSKCENNQNDIVISTFDIEKPGEISENVFYSSEPQTIEETDIIHETERTNDVSNNDANSETENTLPLNKTKNKRGKSKTPPYECKKCCETFPVYYLLKEHYKKAQHPKTGYDKRPCPTCAKLVSYSHMRIHMRTHTKDKPYCCEYCGKRFIIGSNLIRHKRTHSGEKPYRCDICGRCFTQSTRMKDHRRLHTGERPYVCNVCGKCFAQSANFRYHLKRHENEDDGELIQKRTRKKGDYVVSSPPLQCDICSQLFKTPAGLKTHLVTHGDKNFVCPECSRGFTTLARLQNHLKSHSAIKPYQCMVCQKCFTMKNSLRSHTFIHTGEKPFACTYCAKAFTQLGQLKYHLRTHSGERPFICSYCGKTFALNGNLTVHMRTHTGVTPYLCPVCKKGFYDSSSMKKHLRGHSTTPQTTN